MVSIEKISKAYGELDLFKNASFKICSRERLGLVGHNGQGKTTLLRMIYGKEDCDSGKIIVPRNYKIGFVEQNINFSGSTVFEEGMLGLVGSEKEAHWKVEKILFGLGFSKDDTKRNPYDISEGFQARLNLAKELISSPDLLLLDEPTNFLDFSSIRWLRDFLANWRKELIIVTHNKNFMNLTTSHIVGINHKRLKKIRGDTDKFYDQVKTEDEVYEKARSNFKKKEKEIFSFVSKFRAKAGSATLVQSRIKTLNKGKIEKNLEKKKKINFTFNSELCSASIMLNVRNVSFSYTNCNPIFEDLSFLVKSNDKICIIGRNGIGKTTLLKIIAGAILPTRGEVIYTPNLVKGVFDKVSIESLSKDRTVEEEILLSHDDLNRYKVRSICGKMMFPGDLATKKIGFLSGGEKTRVVLAKLMATPLNLLLLDEPTNHLDLDLCNALLIAIKKFSGAVIMVTHDESFLRSISKRLIIINDGEVKFFNGDYQTFLDKEGFENKNKLVKKFRKDDKITKKKEKRKVRSKIIIDKSRDSAPIKQEMFLLEKEIQLLENRLGEIQEDLILASRIGRGSVIQELSRQIYDHERGIETKINKLEQLDRLLQQIKDNTSKRLLDIL